MLINVNCLFVIYFFCCRRLFIILKNVFMVFNDVEIVVLFVGIFMNNFFINFLKEIFFVGFVK